MPRTSRPKNEYEAATTALKRALKQQKVTYGELARRIGLSESGVKKILTAEDGSFQRLAQICEALGLSMRELLAGIAEGEYPLAYSLSQQEYLAANPKAWRLYWALLYERRPLAEAERVAGVSPRESFPLLRKLDQLQLLELLPGGRVRVAPVRQVRWVGGGPLVKKLYRDWSVKLLDSVSHTERRPGEFFLLRYYRASKRTLDDLHRALAELETEFTRRAVSEMRTEDPDLVHLRWLTAVDSRSYLEG